MEAVPDHFESALDGAQFRALAGVDGVELYRAQLVHHAFEPHTHEGYGLGVIDTGVERFRYKGSDHLAPAGSLILMNPDTLHTGEAATQAGWRYRMAYIHPDLMRAVTGRPPGLFAEPVRFDPARAAAVAQVLQALWEPGPELHTQGLLLTLLDLLQPLSEARATPTPSGAPRFDRVLACMQDRLADELRLAELAQEAQLSPYHFLRSFKREFHVTPQQMLMAFRLAQAKRLLARGQRPADVAAACGLTDQAHLTRCLRQRYGVTPGQYQAQLGTRPAKHSRA